MQRRVPVVSLAGHRSPSSLESAGLRSRVCRSDRDRDSRRKTCSALGENLLARWPAATRRIARRVACAPVIATAAASSPGPSAIAAALDAGEPVRLVLVAREPQDPAVRAARRARQGARRPGARDQRARRSGGCRRRSRRRRSSRWSAGPPDADRATVLASGGHRLAAGRPRLPRQHRLRDPTRRGVGRARACSWTAPSSTRGAARRCAPRCARTASCPCSGSRRSTSSRGARAAGRRVLAVEDVGTRAPWRGRPHASRCC